MSNDKNKTNTATQTKTNGNKNDGAPLDVFKAFAQNAKDSLAKLEEHASTLEARIATDTADLAATKHAIKAISRLEKKPRDPNAPKRGGRRKKNAEGVDVPGQEGSQANSAAGAEATHN